MNIESGRWIASLVLASWCASTFAGGELADPAVGGDWNADATWSGGVRPQAGEAVSVTPSGNITLTMSADDATDYKHLYFRTATSASSATSVEFDGRGHALLLPYSAAGNYAASPFGILDGSGAQALKLDDSKLDAADKAKAAPLLLDNAHFTLSQAADGGITFRMDSGTFNALDPEGTAYGAREIVMSNGSEPFAFELVNGAKAVFPKLYAGYTKVGSMLFDNAELTVRGATEFGRYNWYYHDSRLTAVATNSVFTFGSDVGFYHATTNVFVGCRISGASGVMASSWDSKVTFKDCAVTNSGTLRIAQDGHECRPAEMVFDGGTYLFGYPQIGYSANANGRLVITGGADFEFLKSGDSQGQHIGWRGTGVVDVVSGTLRTPQDAYCQLRVGQYKDNYGTGWGRLNVYDGGHVVIRFGSAGWMAGATEGLAVGGAGHGEAHVYGGRIDAPQVNVAFAESALGTESFIRQTEGTVAVNTGNSANYSRVGIMTFCNAGGGTWNDRDFANHGAYYLDGGVLEAARIVGGKGSACQGGRGWSKFSADGGTFRQNMSPASYVTLTGFDVAEFGAKGLTFDSNGFDVKIEQDLVNKDGEEGLFVKTGAGTLTYRGSCSVSRFVVSGGTLRIAADAIVSSALCVDEGGTLSFVGGAADLNVATLAVTNATVELDPGQTVTVGGNAAFRGLQLKFTSAPAKDEAQTVFVIRGSLDAESAAELRRAFCDVTLEDGTHAQFRIKDEGGVSIVTVTVEDEADPIGPENTLTWIGSGSWDASSNWSPSGTPDETKKAAFAESGAGKSVTVGSAAIAGAVTFGADGYVLAGDGSLEIAGEQGAAQIEATAGENTVSVPMAFDSVVSIPVADGAKLTLDAPIASGGMRKSGEGTLRLSGDNAFQSEVSLNGGRVSVGGDAFGFSAVSPVRFTKGILEFDSADGDAVEISRAIRPEAGDRPIVLDAKTDAKFPFDYTSARIFKRGVGALELMIGGVVTMNGCGRMNVNDYNWKIAFDEKGNVDEEASQYMSGTLVVAEGKVRIAAKPGLASMPKIDCNKCVNVGGQYAAAQASAELELDGVELNLNANSSGSLRIGSGMTASDSSNAPVPALRMKNAKISSVYYPTFGDRTTAGVTPTFTMTNSTFVGRVQTYFGGVYGSASMRFEATDSRLEVGDVLLIACGLSADVTNTVVSANDGKPGRFQFQASYSADRCSQGYFRLAAGSDFRMSAVAWNDVSPYAKSFRLVFDDATWTTGDADFALSREAAYPVAPTLFSVELQAGGLKLPVAAGRTFATDCRFWGEGGIAKSGEGTLRFGPGAYQFKGPLCALAGSVDLSDAGTITNACFGAGAGTIADGTLKDPVFRLDAGAPNLVNCTVSGRGYLDVGDEPLAKPYPTDMTVLRFTGKAPDVSNWRLRGAGKKGLGATFAVKGNEVRATIEECGLLLIFR